MNGDSRRYTNNEILEFGKGILAENLGHVNAEQFISAVRGSCPDYTVWRRQAYDDMTLEEYTEMVLSDATDNPFEKQ